MADKPVWATTGKGRESLLRSKLNNSKLDPNKMYTAEELSVWRKTGELPKGAAERAEESASLLKEFREQEQTTVSTETIPGLKKALEASKQDTTTVPEPKKEVGLAGFKKPVEQPLSYQEALDKFADYQKRQADKAEEAIKNKPEESLDVLQAQISKMYEGLDKKDREWMQDKQARFNGLYQNAIDQRQENVSRAEWGQIAQTLAQAFATIGAAAQGLRTGRDTTSGLRFSPVNWDRQFDRVEQDYRVAVGDIRRQETDFEDTEKQSSGIRRELTREQTNNLIRNFVNQKSESGQLEKEAVRARESAYDAAIKAGYAKERAQEEASKAMLNTDAAKQLAKRNKYIELAKAGILNEEKPVTISKKIIDAGGTAEEAKQITDMADSMWQSNRDKAVRLLDRLKTPLADSPRPVDNKQPLSAEDTQALNWARQNPEDPRAEQIFNRLGQR